MYLREDIIKRYLASSRPQSFDLTCLEEVVAATETLYVSRVIDISCFRSGYHEFLVVQFESSNLEQRFWMRLDRMPEFSRAALRISRKTAPAHDTYSFNYDRDTLVRREGKNMKLVETLTQLSQAPSMMDLVLLMNIIRDVSQQWQLLGTNCRWFCAVTLDSLQRQFVGRWTMNAFHPGVGHFRGLQGPATVAVRELYRPRFQPSQRPRVPSEIAVAGAISTRVTSPSLGVGEVVPGPPTETRAEHADGREEQSTQHNVFRSTEMGHAGRLGSIVGSLVDPNLPDPKDEELVRKILAMQALSTPREMWECFGSYLPSSHEHATLAQIQRLLKLSHLWACHCRVPSQLLAEMRTAFRDLGLDSLQPPDEVGHNLSTTLAPATIFGQIKPTDSQHHNTSTEDILSISPERTAVLLRSMEVEIRSSYLEAEIITSYSWYCSSRATTEPDQCILPFSETVVIWVKVCFISAVDTKTRIAVFNYFEKLARECYKQRNYATTISVITALADLNVQDLKITFKRIGRKKLKALETLKSDCLRRCPGTIRSKRLPAPVWPFQLSGRTRWVLIGLANHNNGLGARRETIELIEGLNNDPDSVFNTEDLMNKICLTGTLKPYKMQSEPPKHNLLGCSAFLLSSMEDACGTWDELKDPNHLAQIQYEERVERDQMRSSIIF